MAESKKKKTKKKSSKSKVKKDTKKKRESLPFVFNDVSKGKGPFVK